MRDYLRLCLKVASRHWAIYRKNLFANLSPTVIDPMMFLLTFGLGLGAFVADVNGMDYIRFIAPGLAVSAALFTAFFETSYNFYVRMTYEHIYKAMTTTPIGVAEIIGGEFLWVTLKGAGMALGVSLVLCLCQVAHWRYILWMPLVGGIVALACGGIGLIATAMVRNINQFQTIYALLISPMFFFSGIFYPLDDMPAWVHHLSTVSPLYHGVRLSQELLWARAPLEAFVSHGPWLALLSVILVTLAKRKILPKLYH